MCALRPRYAGTQVVMLMQHTHLTHQVPSPLLRGPPLPVYAAAAALVFWQQSQQLQAWNRLLAWGPAARSVDEAGCGAAWALWLRAPR